MEKQNYIAAIDIGTTKIVAIAGIVHRDRDNNVQKIEVISHGIAKARGMKRGMINDLKDVIDSIAEATEKARFKQELNVKDLYVGVSGYTIRSFPMRHQRLIPSGKITQHDIDTLTMEVYKTAVNENEEVLHVIPYEYIIDDTFRHANPVGIDGKRLDGKFYLIVSDTKFINGIRTALRQLGFSVKKVIFEPLASAEAVLTPEEKEAGVALLDIGGGTTDLVVFHNHHLLFSKVIPFGGNTITEDIKRGFKILFAQAEEIKIKYGSAIATRKQENEKIKIPGIAGRPPKIVSQRTLSIIIQSRITEIIDTVHNLLNNYVDPNHLAVGMTITGGGALLKDLKQFVKYRTGLDVRIASPTIATVEELNSPQYATTLGLLIKGQEYEQQLTGQQTDDRQAEQEPEQTQEKKRAGFFKNVMHGFKNLFNNLTSDVDDDIN